MINITKKEIKMSSDLITKLKWACVSNYKATNGSLRIIDHTNIAYVEPHKVIINNILFFLPKPATNAPPIIMLSLKIVFPNMRGGKNFFFFKLIIGGYTPNFS